MSVASGAIIVSRTTLSTTAFDNRTRPVEPFVSDGLCMDRLLRVTACSGSVLVVRHVVEPRHDVAVVISFLDGHVRHEAFSRRAVPVLLAGLDVDDVAGADLLHPAGAGGDASDPVGHVERLTLGV